MEIKKYVKIWIKRICLIALIPVLLVLLIVFLLYIPFVQNFVVKKAVQYVSDSVGMNIHIGNFRLTYPLNLTLQDVYAMDSTFNPIMSVKELRINLLPAPLLHKDVSISHFSLSEAQINTHSLIEGIEIQGVIGSLDGNAESISLINEEATVNRLNLSDANLTIRIDSIPTSNTDSTKNNWKVFTDDIQLDKLALSIQLPTDSIQITSFFDNVSIAKGVIDLKEERYDIGQFLLTDASVNYDLGTQEAKMGLDPSHIIFSNINAGIDSISYQPDDMQAVITSFSANERSGLTITSMTGKLQMKEASVIIPYYTIQSPYSTISAQITAPLEMPAKNSGGFLFTQLTAVLDKRDFDLVMGEWSNPIIGLRPEQQLILSCLIEGNMNKLYLHQFNGEFPGVFQIDANGFIQEAADSILRSGTVDLTVSIHGKELMRLIPAQYTERFSLPDTVRLGMQAALQEGIYSADMLVTERQGKMELSGEYNPSVDKYIIDFKVDSIVPIHFLPQDSILWLTASLQAEGQGWDVFADSTVTRISGLLTEVQYKDISLSGISFDGSLKNNKIQGTMASVFPYIKGNMTIDGDLQKDRLSGMLILDMDTLDLYGMNITQQPFSNTFQIFSEFDTDLKKRHQLDVTLGNWDMFLSERTVSPKTLILHANANEDTTRVSLHAGDLGVILTADTDIETLTDKFIVLSDSLNNQLKQYSFTDIQQLRPIYPQLNLRIEAQNDNPLYNYLQNNNTYFDRFYVNASVSPEEGFTMDGMMLSLIKDTMKIDTIRLDVRQDTIGLKYAMDVVKNRFRRQEPYQAELKGSLMYGGGEMEMVYRDEHGTPGFQIGVRAEKQQEGYNFRIFPENPILAFMPFQVNENNYVKIKNLKDISANLRLTGADNTSVWIHSEEDDGKMQELLAEINAIDLQRISGSFLQMPSMKGLADMSIRYVPEENTFMIVADANVNNLVYQNEKVGELLLNGVYLPLDNEEHQLDMHLFQNNEEVSTLYTHYQPKKNNRIEGAFEIHTLALSSFNPFLTGMAKLNGAVQSAITISGTAEQPLLEGYMQLDTASVYSTATGSSFRFDDKKVEIKNNTIHFNRFGIYSAGNNPFLVDGTIGLNINNPVKSIADLRMNANNMQLLDSRKNKENIVFGRLYVDLKGFTAKGPLSSLVMRGNLNLLGNTNMTLIMKESPLAVNDRMENLVSFSYFNDTIPRRRTLSGQRINRESMPVEGLDMLLAIHIDPAVKIAIELDDEGSNRVELEGGGDLYYQYTPQEDMALMGRYSLSGGLIKYNMPIIANKTLRIRENSYLDWSGDIMDPYLNLRATERIRTNVSTEDGKSSRSVNFDAGIELRQQMENLQLQFTLEALDDASLQNQLTALGAEERSKRSIGLFLTGMYLDEDQSGKIKFDMGTAINSFLQTEINQITGDLLKGVDFNFGMENYDRMGMEGTNYSFRFSKRFYNDRFNVVLGGNVTTGMPNDNNTFINDASIEYRLDPAGSRYAKLFYQRQYESLLEGEITKYGGGVVFRRKVRRLGDLFLFERKKKETNIDTNIDN